MASNNALTQYEPKIITKDIQDVYVRKNFQLLQDHFMAQNQLLNFKFFEVIFTKASTNYKLAHGFNYVPEDILITKLVGTGSLTFNYGLFDTTNLDITVTGPCRLRFFVGSYWNFETKTADAPTDTFQISPTVAAGITEIVNYLTVNNITNVFNSTSSSSSTVTRVVTGTGYSVKTTDDEIYVTATATIQLLPANTAGAKPVTVVVTGDGYLVTVARGSADTILGEVAQVQTRKYSAVTYFPDGSTKYYVK